MNRAELPKTEQTPPKPWIDPVLQELWEIKRAINVEAKFDVKEIARMANASRLDNVLQRTG